MKYKTDYWDTLYLKSFDEEKQFIHNMRYYICNLNYRLENISDYTSKYDLSDYAYYDEYYEPTLDGIAIHNLNIKTFTLDNYAIIIKFPEKLNGVNYD